MLANRNSLIGQICHELSGIVPAHLKFTLTHGYYPINWHDSDFSASADASGVLSLTQVITGFGASSLLVTLVINAISVSRIPRTLRLDL